MTCQWMSRSRTFAASSTQRLVSQAHGHSGSNQKSTRAVTGALCTASVMLVAPPFSRSRAIATGCAARQQAGSDRSCSRPGGASPPGRLRLPAAPRGKLTGVAVPNLTRDEAAARAELLAVQSYDLQLDVTDGAGHAGERDVRVDDDGGVQLPPPGADTFVDLVAETVHSATLNGTELDVSSYTEEGGLPLPGLAEQNTLVVVADCRYSNTGEGLHRFEDPEDGQVYLYSHFEPAEAKRMFACFDQPDLKAPFTST